MSSRKVNIADLLNVAIIAAQSAGAEILTAKNNGTFDTNIKGFVNGDEDFVTSVDKTAQRIIIGFLRHYFNDLNIIGEEEDVSYSDTLPAHKKLETIPTDACPCELKHVDKDRVCIFIDPLDATREFVKGDVQCVMCLIGISVDGKPTAGVCFQPFVDRAEQMTWGLCGYGTSLDQNQRGSYAQSLVSHAELTVIYSGRADALTEKAVQLLNPAQVLRASGAGYKTLLLIKQKATVQIATSGTKLWDTCAPHAILSACGGSMTDFNGMAIEYKFNSPLTNGPLIATLGWAHQECISKLSQMTD